MKEKNSQDAKQRYIHPNKIAKKGKNSKDFIKTEINHNKNIHKNLPKLRQNNNFKNVNNNLKAKPKSDPNKKLIHLFEDLSREKENNKSQSLLYKQNNIFINEGNISSISSEKEYKFRANSDSNIFFKSNEKTIKINLKKISKKTNDKPTILNINTNYGNLKYIPLNDISSLFNAWQNSFIIYKAFEDKLLDKNNFEINRNTLKIISKNTDSCKLLNDQKFWILYIEYLITNNLLLNESQFITLINEAFSYMEGKQFSLLKNYYIQKIKKYSPICSYNGISNDNDEIYINKLNKSVINLIKSQKQQNGFSSFTVLKNRRISYSEKKENEELNNKFAKNLYNVFNEMTKDSNDKKE